MDTYTIIVVFIITLMAAFIISQGGQYIACVLAMIVAFILACIFTVFEYLWDGIVYVYRKCKQLIIG